MKRLVLRFVLLVAAGLVACSVEISQTVEATPFPTIAPLGTPFNPTSSPVTAPADSGVGSSTTPLPSLPSLSLEGYDFGGQIIVAHGQQGVIRYDMVTGQNQTLFQPPVDGLVTSATVSPDGTTVMMAYSPPPPEGQIQLGYTGLYALPADGSGEAQVLLEGDLNDVYFGPAWSPDGQTIYYGHFEAGRADADASGISIERMAYPNGQAETLLDDALWPTLSPDGSKVAYISIDFVNYVDELYVANADGSNPQPVLEKGLFSAVDAPRFGPDGETILFSAVVNEPFSSSDTSWLASLFGLEVARAHAVPSDLFTAPAGGGQPTRLTELGAVGMNADYAPDGQTIGFITSEGIHVMNPDGSGLAWLLDQPGLITFQWVP